MRPATGERNFAVRFAVDLFSWLGVMPIYEYQCLSCAEELEALQKISDQPLRECPSCGRDELRKKVSAAAFRLKGGGWYETDFKTGDKKYLAGDDKPAANDGPGKEAAVDKSSSAGAGSTGDAAAVG